MSTCINPDRSDGVDDLLLLLGPRLLCMTLTWPRSLSQQGASTCVALQPVSQRPSSLRSDRVSQHVTFGSMNAVVSRKAMDIRPGHFLASSRETLEGKTRWWKHIERPREASFRSSCSLLSLFRPPQGEQLADDQLDGPSTAHTVQPRTGLKCKPQEQYHALNAGTQLVLYNLFSHGPERPI